MSVRDVQLAKILYSVWLSFGIMISVKVGNNLAPSGNVDTLYLAISNLKSLYVFCLLKNMLIGNP